MTRLLFCQNDSPMGRSFWQKDSLITYILFGLCLLWYLAHSQILGISLYEGLQVLLNFENFHFQDTLFLSALFRVLIGLTMTEFSEKLLVSTRCIHGFISNLTKKSWTDSKLAAASRHIFWQKTPTPPGDEPSRTTWFFQLDGCLNFKPLLLASLFKSWVSGFSF